MPATTRIVEVQSVLCRKLQKLKHHVRLCAPHYATGVRRQANTPERVRFCLAVFHDNNRYAVIAGAALQCGDASFNGEHCTHPHGQL